MSDLIESLPWDTEFFSMPIGCISKTALDEETARLVIDEAHLKGVRCLYFEADPQDSLTVRTVEKFGFHLADVRIVLECPFEKRPAPLLRYPFPDGLIIYTGMESDLEYLEDIAMETSQYSRFSFDHHFKLGEEKRLYQLWIRNSFAGFSDIVFAARWRSEKKHVAVGLVACKIQNEVGHIQLAGVHHRHRKKGVGTGLIQAALDWAIQKGATKMQVVTQARNVPAQRLYQQMGFYTKSTTLYYHKWL